MANAKTVTTRKQTKLNTRQFHIPPAFSKNNDITAGFRADKRFLHIVNKMFAVAKPVMPWDTVSDFYRWAVWEGLQKVNGIITTQELDDDVASVKAVIALLRNNEMEQQAMAIISETQRTINKLELDGGHDEVLDLLTQVHELISKVSKDSHLGIKLRKAFKAHFGQYFEKKSIKERYISLNPNDAENEDDDGW